MSKYILHKAKDIKVRPKRNQGKTIISVDEGPKFKDEPYWKERKMTDRLQLEIERLNRAYKRGEIEAEDLISQVYEEIEYRCGFKIPERVKIEQIKDWLDSLKKNKFPTYIRDLTGIFMRDANSMKLEAQRSRHIFQLQKLLNLEIDGIIDEEAYRLDNGLDNEEEL